MDQTGREASGLDALKNKHPTTECADQPSGFKLRKLADATIACAKAATSTMSTVSNLALILQKLLVRVLTPKWIVRGAPETVQRALVDAMLEVPQTGLKSA